MLEGFHDDWLVTHQSLCVHQGLGLLLQDEQKESLLLQEGKPLRMDEAIFLVLPHYLHSNGVIVSLVELFIPLPVLLHITAQIELYLGKTLTGLFHLFDVFFVLLQIFSEFLLSFFFEQKVGNGSFLRHPQKLLNVDTIHTRQLEHFTFLQSKSLVEVLGKLDCSFHEIELN